MFSLLSELDTALASRDYKDRCRTANLILIRCWSYIKDFMEFCKDQAEDTAPGGSGSGDSDNLLSKLLSSLMGGSEEGSGDTAPVDAGSTSSSPG